MFDNPDFYPTPRALADKMLAKVDLKRVENVLEPSAGKGDLLKALREANIKFSGHYDYKKKPVDCIERDEKLVKMLEGMDERVVYDDFLDFTTFKRYDLVLMNPPFSEGDKHLLKALSIMQHGGQIVCLLNAETLKNPYTNTRKDLKSKLEQYEADVEYISNSFRDAERRTDVEIALVYVNIPATEPMSLILDGMEDAPETGVDLSQDSNITFYDLMRRMVSQYEYEAKIGIKLIEEYCRLQPYVINGLTDERFRKPIIEMSVNGKDLRNAHAAVNGYLEGLRYKYWSALGKNELLMKRLTSNLLSTYMDKLIELKHKEFNVHNIEMVNKELMSQMNVAVEDAILKMFDDLSYQHSYNNEYSTNIHYYNGWCTNKAHYVNKKVIVPFLNCRGWDDTIRVDDYNVGQKLADIEKIFDYLENGSVSEYFTMNEVLAGARRTGITKNVRAKYFDIDFYKKGTVHIKFRNLEILKKFNIFGSQKKGWLPPAYGKKRYKDLSDDERAVVDSFDGGESEYDAVVENKDYYLIGSNSILQITA